MPIFGCRSHMWAAVWTDFRSSVGWIKLLRAYGG